MPDAAHSPESPLRPSRPKTMSHLIHMVEVPAEIASPAMRTSMSARHTILSSTGGGSWVPLGAAGAAHPEPSRPIFT
ncbi:hypothetical protein E2C01_011493 [Portunus trituberculatus]|uniref:Uncharacterized protein n=1 Tax=Portunus trituberculatus TaxID=210409 RepID=A0A5B7DC32_PORTR|nr:hypothetical protein [Portunus trituberculatus]